MEFLSFNEFVRFWVILCNEIGSSPGDESSGMKTNPVRKTGGDIVVSLQEPSEDTVVDLRGSNVDIMVLSSRQPAKKALNRRLDLRRKSDIANLVEFVA